MTHLKLKEVCEKFAVEGEFHSFEQIKSGNINQTYLVNYIRDGIKKPYIIQQVNTYVFKNPEQVMNNIAAVTEHIRKKIKETGISAKRYVLHYLHTSEGKSYWYDSENKFWRGYRFIDESVTYDASDDLNVMEQAGIGFGRFQKYLADFDASVLYESIPDFHNTEKRFDRLFRVASEDPMNRAKDVKKELDYLESHRELSLSLCNMLKNGELPLRVTHNDTKINNVIFDKATNQSLAVIDLDTVMPGLCAYDFGDAIRFGANDTIEDDPDLSNINLNLEKYEAYTKGFIGTIRDSLTKKELETMYLGAYVMTVELVARFMTDYLEGDVYFKLNYPEHNLIRTRAQDALARDMENKLDKMSNIVNRYY